MSHSAMDISPSPAARSTVDRDDRRLQGRWLVLARAGWITTALATLVLEFAATPVAWRLLNTVCVASQCAQNINQLTIAKAQDLRAAGISLGLYAVIVIVLQWLGTLLFVGIGALIFWRRSDDHMALFAAFMLVTFPGGAGGWTSVLPDTSRIWVAPVNVIGVAGQVAFYLFFCLFPSGHFVPSWMRWPALVYAVLWLMTLLPFAPLNLNSVATSPNIVFISLICVLVFGQVYRYRTASTALERRQTKWVVSGFALGLGAFVALLTYGNLVLGPQQRNTGRGELFANVALTTVIWFVPISIGVAILRSRLWDIDIIIRRTLIYGTLTATLAVVYFGTVLAAQFIVQAMTGQNRTQDAVLVGSTLLIATLFQPLRRRIQSAIDQRFYRRRYNASHTLAAFAMTLRSETDLQGLRERLVGVVAETMQPAHVSLWLREPRRPDDSPRGQDWFGSQGARP